MNGDAASDPEPGRIGFVVIGRNEGPRLERCLQSVLAISDRVIYADSASTDGSADVAKGFGVATVVLPEDGKLSAARGRNAGYSELIARFPGCAAIQFVDGDCILQPGWIEQGLAFLRNHPKVAVVCGRRFEAHPEASIYNALCDQEWNTPVGETTECGGDAMVRRSAFDEVGGYLSALRAGEEPEMTARMRAAGWQIWRIDAPMTEHDARILSLRQWWRRTQRGGFGYAQVWEATKGLSQQQLYARNLRSAIIWALAIPLASILTAIVAREPMVMLCVPVAYGLQLIRLARRSRGTGKSRWANAALILLAKFPEVIGATRYFISGDDRSLPEYKAHA